jgi:hypothetical protein
LALHQCPCVVFHFMSFFFEKYIVCHGQKNHEPTCCVKFYIYNSNVC